uniref:Uncharacterized protein n=1 Tax=Octopus bimaculoides TaxID=37653 RepID=A0A0L8FGC0_OCTBM
MDCAEDVDLKLICGFLNNLIQLHFIIVIMFFKMGGGELEKKYAETKSALIETVI